MLTTQSIFDRYQEVRARFPRVTPREGSLEIQSLLDIVDQVDAFVFDAFGVLNVGETLIPGADERLDQLRAHGCAIRILTNAASYDRNGAIAKFKRLGLRVEDDEIITSREATLKNLEKGHWGVIAADSDTLSDLPETVTRLGDTQADYDKVDRFLFLSTADWTTTRQDLLVASMRDRPRSLRIGNADLAAPRDDGFSVEPGFFGHQIADQFPEHVKFFGKPFAEVYDLTEASLPSIPSHRIAMCGDTLHTDILGAAACGWRTVLVTKDGLFAGYDTRPFSKQSRLFADWRLDRI
ncbi:Haloacid Dehalogenase Superfamily Class (subfamily) IIA [Roseovarius marisflavi]|uniref:Haloacid Dehalogenase Superfamily Class (Subfamily) IIA n=1 Tax=Roseovarius marisflavi TaxID=1054996 RepID=A0A1M6ZJE6_9RHOB|nr:HAD hydrolase-like protein [Roseovarius marisflavi]SHL30479.1 Haloacid Dehalogenase Superfamily Class (subfamily) IIA [Roseovarius marisflavi]